jgi:hypothetical protein
MAEKINIFNYLWLNENIATGGQATDKQLCLIKEAGNDIASEKLQQNISQN